MKHSGTASPQQKADPPSENRVVVFSRSSIPCAGSFGSEPVELRHENGSMGTTTASGVFCWLSNDPIGISGGLNQYVFCGNNPVNFVDPFGCNPYGTPPPRWALPWRVYYAYYGGTHMVGYYSPTGQAGLGPQDIGPPGGPYPIDWMDHAFMFHDQDLACAPSHSGIRQAHSMLQIRLLVAPFRHPLPNHIQRPNLIRAWATIPVFFLAHPGSRLGHEFGNGHDDSGMVTFTFFELGF